jgi:hypothetical protein
MQLISKSLQEQKQVSVIFRPGLSNHRKNNDPGPTPVQTQAGRLEKT